MNKPLVATVVVLVVAGGAYYLFAKNGSSGAPAQTVPPTMTTAPAVPAVNAAVSIQNFSFGPPTLSVKTGTRVTWTNNDPVTHTVSPDSSGTFSPQTLAPGQSFSFVFSAPGTLSYHCAIHPMMKGIITTTD